ncbi:MAG: hypothetical protein DDT26_02435 [Dehalococcoidia bacterium]|nr:hypothetical protein [Chloroflexota bacterium]
MPYPTLFLADKAVAQFPGWSAPEPETDYVWFNAPLEIGGVIEAGLVLHGGCYSRKPDKHVTLELIARSPGGRKMPLARIDWRSPSGHTNQRRAGSPVSGMRVSETHHHAFELNWLEAERRIRRGNLPQASEIEQEIQSFESLRVFAGNQWRINNIAIVSVPPWAYDLFQDG